MATYPYERLRDPDASARLSASLIVPAITSVPCIAWMTAGDDSIPLSRRNLATRGLMSVQGTPVVHPGYVRTTGNSNYFKSNISEPPTFTWFVFGRRSDTSADNPHTGAYGGSFFGITDPGCLFYWQTSTIIRGQAYQGSGTNITTTLSVASNSDKMKQYRLECVRSGSSGTITIFNDTDGTQDNTPGVFTDVADLGGFPISFGSSNSNSFGGHIEWNHQSIFSGIPTADEVDAHWAQVLAIAADMGVTPGM